MKIVIAGASEVAVLTAKRLIGSGHQLVIIEQDREKIDRLSDELDCSFLHGDASQPHVLREAGPDKTDVLFCLTNNDQANIIASVVGRSLGYPRIFTSIQDEEYEHICEELGLVDTIVPARTISRYLADLAEGLEVMELRSALKGDARVFVFTIRPEDAGPIADLSLPRQTSVACFYRDGKFMVPEAETRLREGDEVVLLTHSAQLSALQERWHPPANSDNAELQS